MIEVNRFRCKYQKEAERLLQQGHCYAAGTASHTRATS
jgi:hypothetical protein